MNKTEASYVNTLLRYVLLDARDEDNPGPETARWAAAQLADRAHAQLTAGISRARCEQLWDAEPPVPRGFTPDPWAETAEGLAAAEADPSAADRETDALRVVAELRDYLSTHGPGSGEQHNEGETAVLTDLRLMLDGRPSNRGRPTLAAPRVVPIEQRGLIAGTARTIARQRRDGGRA